MNHNGGDFYKISVSNRRLLVNSLLMYHQYKAIRLVLQGISAGDRICYGSVSDSTARYACLIIFRVVNDCHSGYLPFLVCNLWSKKSAMLLTFVILILVYITEIC